MADARLLSFDEMEILTRRRVCINHRIFLVVGPASIEPAVKSEKNARVQSVRKTRWRKDHVIGAFAFMPGEWVGQGLEGDQRLNAGAADDPPGAILGVVVRETKILRQSTDVGSGNEIQFIRTQRFLGGHQAANAVIA